MYAVICSKTNWNQKKIIISGALDRRKYLSEIQRSAKKMFILLDYSDAVFD